MLRTSFRYSFVQEVVRWVIYGDVVISCHPRLRQVAKIAMCAWKESVKPWNDCEEVDMWPHTACTATKQDYIVTWKNNLHWLRWRARPPQPNSKYIERSNRKGRWPKLAQIRPSLLLIAKATVGYSEVPAGISRKQMPNDESELENIMGPSNWPRNNPLRVNQISLCFRSHPQPTVISSSHGAEY